MEPKRKIVIPLGDASREEAVQAGNYDGGVTVPAPLFDEEATISARPVVPLAGVSTVPSGRFPLLAVVIILAVAAGVAGGFAIGVYKSRQNRTAAATTTNTAATTASTDAPAQTQAEQLPVIASKQSSEPQRHTTEAENAPTERPARDSKPAKDDEQIIPPVEVRERVREAREARRERDDKIKDDGEPQREVKRQKKEQRRRAREADERDADLNEQIERAGREVNRIRDIFEGQRP
jgi:hypothetical protein